MAETITINPPNDLAPGESVYINFADSQPPTPDGLPSLPKRGWLLKRGPFDGVVFDSYFAERLRGEADGMGAGVPSDTARTLDSEAVGSFVRVTNPATNANTLTNTDLEIILFGPEAGAEESGVKGLQFSGSAVIADLVPGVTTARR